MGSQSFVENLDAKMQNRRQTEVLAEGGTWVLRENYESLFDAENRAITVCGAIKY